MLKDLKKIYQNKIIEKVTDFDYTAYYYFFNSENNELFGIEKTISPNEYQLIQASFIEKKIYDNNKENQKIYEYLFDNAKYPFKKNKVKIILCEKTNLDYKEIFSNFYKEVYALTFSDFVVLFCIDAYDVELDLLLKTLSDDAGVSFKLHDGIYIDNQVPGQVVLQYLSIVKNYQSNHSETYSDFITPLLNLNDELYMNIIETYVLNNIFQDALTKDMILTYFKNDLNVSQTAKDLYMNRNSLLNKFDNIYKNTGIQLQKFNHACAMNLYLIKKK